MKIVFFREVNKMLSKKKKVFILLGMVALLVVTGCLNMFLSRSEENVQTTNISSASLLTSYRASKLETRNSMLELYDSIIETLYESSQNNELLEDSKLTYLASPIFVNRKQKRSFLFSKDEIKDATKPQ